MNNHDDRFEEEALVRECGGPLVVSLEDFKREQDKWVDQSVTRPVLVLDEDGDVLIEMDMVRNDREFAAAGE